MDPDALLAADLIVKSMNEVRDHLWYKAYFVYFAYVYNLKYNQVHGPVFVSPKEVKFPNVIFPLSLYKRPKIIQIQIPCIGGKLKSMKMFSAQIWLFVSLFLAESQVE